jgi:hypothetical protein
MLIIAALAVAADRPRLEEPRAFSRCADQTPTAFSVFMDYPQVREQRTENVACRQTLWGLMSFGGKLYASASTRRPTGNRGRGGNKTFSNGNL